jgi:hypothetical protein
VSAIVVAPFVRSAREGIGAGLSDARAKLLCVRRTLPIVLVVVAALADTASATGLAFYALVAAVPFAAVASLDAYAELLDAGSRARVVRAQALLWPAALALIVLSAAARAPAIAEGAVPRFGSTALLACLLVFLVQAVFAGVAFFREPVRAGSS